MVDFQLYTNDFGRNNISNKISSSFYACVSKYYQKKKKIKGYIFWGVGGGVVLIFTWLSFVIV